MARAVEEGPAKPNFQALAGGGIGPSTCELILERSVFTDEDELEIEHSSSRSYFVLRKESDGVFSGRTLVGEDPPEQFDRSTWDEALGYVFRWAEEVAYYENTPDLWTELQRAKEALTSGEAGALQNTPFTPAEQAEVSNQLREIKASLKENSELTTEQISRIEDRLDEAEKASRRLGRKDWLLLFSGTIFTLIVTDCLTPDVAQHILMGAFTD